MKLQKFGIYFLVLALVGVLALGCGNGAAPEGEKYAGEAQGFGGAVKVDVYVDDDGAITDIKVVENSETAGIGDTALEELIPQIVEAGGTEGVDVKTGATVSSGALFDAVNDALSKVE